MAASFRIIPRNFHHEATLSTEFAAADGCSIVNTQNRKRSRVWRSDTTTAADASDNQYIAGTFDDGDPREPDYFAFFRHRCHGGQVRLQLYSDAGWTSQVWDSTPVDVIRAVGADGADFGIDPYFVGAFDPHIIDSPFYLRFDPVSCLSYKVTFSGNVATFGAAYWEVCTFMLGRSFAPARQPVSFDLGVIDLTEVDRSRGGSLYSNIGAQARTLRLLLESVNEDERAAWLDIVRQCGLGRDLALTLYDGEATRRERDHVMYGTFSALDAIGRSVTRWNLLTKSLQFQEA
jgi:hypothetical protein